VGMQRAKELLLSARELDAATAHDWGMVTEVVPAESLMARARAIAASLATASATGIGLIKSALARTFESDLASMLNLEAAAQAIAFSTDYHRAAAKRFVDKQPPLFQWPSAASRK
jgi:2-(1,2-epoxy-1,2-dihydrophenyl)acetyl-CoA isomerase